MSIVYAQSAKPVRASDGFKAQNLYEHQLNDVSEDDKQPDKSLLAIELWLLDKYALSQSMCTATTYRDILTSLHTYLQAHGLTLNQPVVTLAAHIQTWAGQRTATSKGQKSVAPATYNQRIAAVSSFYQWAIESGMYTGNNPAEQISRAPVKKYAKSRALDPNAIRVKLKDIDCETPQGLRDYVLLQVALNTGHSLQELASLTWRCVHIENDQVTLTFERCKGGRTLYDTLDSRLSQAFLAYLHTIYGTKLEQLAPDAPIWVSFSDRNYHQAIGPQTIADICEKRLGISTVQALRHTFALVMEQQGAQVRTIQERLGRKSLSETGTYLSRLKQAFNPHASALAEVFGV